MDTTPTIPVAHPLVVQHNALVNARFDLNTVESRLFLALLTRIQREDTAFAKCQVPVREIMAQTVSKSSYAQVRKMLQTFAGRTLLVEELGPDGRPQKDPGFVVIPMLHFARYVKGEGLIEARFNDELLPYLLQLRDNFTKAQLTELLKLKSGSSYRIYWLLREYATFGKRTIRLDELKAVLGLDQEYDRFDNFRARVLERAKLELAQTDLPFTYEAIKAGREVTEIRFSFTVKPAALPAPLPAELPGWEQALLGVGISAASLPAVRARLAAGDYDEGYVHYVLATVRARVAAGKVRKEGGAVFKALTEGHFIAEYRKEKTKDAPAGPPAAGGSRVPTPAAAAARNRKRSQLLDQVEDAVNTLDFICTTLLYGDEERAARKATHLSVLEALNTEYAGLLSPAGEPNKAEEKRLTVINQKLQQLGL